MSTLKTNNVQVGQSLTATNNFTLYQPSTPDGTVRLGVGNSGATTLDAVTVNSSGNVGVGTSSPAAKLDIVGTGTTSGIKVRSGGNTGINIIDVADAGGSGGLILTATGNLQFNSGYGSTATAYGCRAWVNFNGTTNVGGFCTIRASGNVTSVTDNGVGDYTVNFTTAMPDANYSVNAQNAGDTIYGSFGLNIFQQLAPTTSSVRLSSRSSAGTFADSIQINVAIFR